MPDRDEADFGAGDCNDLTLGQGRVSVNTKIARIPKIGMNSIRIKSPSRLRRMESCTYAILVPVRPALTVLYSSFACNHVAIQRSLSTRFGHNPFQLFLHSFIVISAVRYDVRRLDDSVMVILKRTPPPPFWQLSVSLLQFSASFGSPAACLGLVLSQYSRYPLLFPFGGWRLMHSTYFSLTFIPCWLL